MSNSQTMSISGTTHTTDEAGCKVVVTKKLRSQLKEDAYRAAGKVIGNAMGKKMNTDGNTLYSGFSSGLGADAAACSPGYLAAAITQLVGQSEPAPEPFAVVLHPYHLNYLVDSLSVPSTSNVPPDYQMDVLMKHWRGVDKLYGAPIFSDGTIAIVTATTTAYGAVYSKSAFIYLVGWEPDNWIVYDDSLRGWEIGIVADYAMVEEDDGYGRYLLFECDVPTS